MRVAVVDIGTNSTRLLIADVDPATDTVIELERRTTVTRLGQGVDASGTLATEAMQRVFATLAEYRAAMDEHEVTTNVAVLTSAVRDASNGKTFTAAVRDRFALDARTIAGDEEARLTFLGATSERPADDTTPTVVIDIGGGSTEFVVGTGHDATFHVSTQAGVVRMTERHLHDDPPTPEQLRALREDVRATITEAIAPDVRSSVERAIAVAGTATSLAAIDQALEPYDPARVHGHAVSIARTEQILGALAAIPDAERRAISGLHPDRAPTIVAGVAMLLEALEAFGLHAFEASEHDILRGAALQLAAGRSSST
jgi:exopolyphosphatase/guanosine-5'-triphosphate,3'-diphosphate pyrophosphatase